MCSFYVRELIDGNWEHKIFPNCEKTTREQFIIHHHTEELITQMYVDSDYGVSENYKEKEEYFYQLKYMDSTSIVLETFKVNKIVTKLLFGEVPVEDIPKLMFQQKWSCRSINKEYKLLPFLEY